MADKLNYKVGMIGALDMLRFKNMPKVREKAIQAASSAPLQKTLTTNEKAMQRHPEQEAVVGAEIRQNGADAKTIVLKTEDGSALAPFRAGQYISVCVPIGGTVTTRSYSLCSSPAWAKRGEYNITVKRDDAGFVSPYIQPCAAVANHRTHHHFHRTIRASHNAGFATNTTFLHDMNKPFITADRTIRADVSGRCIFTLTANCRRGIDITFIYMDTR